MRVHLGEEAWQQGAGMVAGVASSKITSGTSALSRESKQEVGCDYQHSKPAPSDVLPLTRFLPKGNLPKQCYQLGAKGLNTQAPKAHVSFKLPKIRQYSKMVSVRTWHTLHQPSLCCSQALEAWASCLLFLCSNYKRGKMTAPASRDWCDQCELMHLKKMLNRESAAW